MLTWLPPACRRPKCQSLLLVFSLGFSAAVLVRIRIGSIRFGWSVKAWTINRPVINDWSPRPIVPSYLCITYKCIPCTLNYCQERPITGLLLSLFFSAANRFVFVTCCPWIWLVFCTCQQMQFNHSPVLVSPKRWYSTIAKLPSILVQFAGIIT